MPAPLVAIVFWTAVVAIVVAQVMILRSTARALRAKAPERPAREWSFAIAPALVLALVLFLSWRSAMRPRTIDVQLPAAPGERRS